MLGIRKTLVGVVAVATFAVGAYAGDAQAQNELLDAETLGAALAIPYLTSTEPTGGDRITIQTVTNGLTEEAVNLHLIWISGDPDDDWAALDFNCNLTPLETTYFIYENTGSGARVTFECSDPGQLGPDPDTTNNVFFRSVPGQDGVLFVALECQANTNGCPGGAQGLRTRGDNALLGDATVLDFTQGYAFSANAIHIQGLTNDGDRLYRFDGTEYAAFPAQLTSNYIAPDDDITLDVLLFTLDGKVNDGPGVVAKVLGFAYDDDENFTSSAVEFDCFVVQDLTEDPNSGFGANITREFGGHLVGHFELFPTDTAASDAHENNPLTGDSNGSRKRPVHGWIIQTIASGGDFDDGNFPMGGAMMAGWGAWARQLVQGTDPLVPIPGDVPSLNSIP